MKMILFTILCVLLVFSVHAQFEIQPNEANLPWKYSPKNPNKLTYLHGKISWVQDGVIGVDVEKYTREQGIYDWEFDRTVAIPIFQTSTMPQ